MKIYVDADACPVLGEIIEVAQSYRIPVKLVKSYSHFSHQEDPTGVETIYVDRGVDAADLRIIQLAEKNDLIVTQDYGLASLALAKGCIVLHHKGFVFKEHNIDHFLQSRHLSAKARRAGNRTKGPKAFTNEDKMKFKQFLKRMIDESHL